MDALRESLLAMYGISQFRPRWPTGVRRETLQATARRNHAVVDVSCYVSGYATGSMTRNDGRLDIAVAIQHVAEHLLQPGERRFSGDVIGRPNLLLRNQGERLAHRLRRVMKSSF